jgi:hypothetical protein
MLLAKLKKNNRYTLPTDDPKDNIVYTITKMNITGITSKSSKDNKIIRTSWKAAMKIDVDKV